MQRLHGLHLVTTSRACDIRPYEHSRTAEEVGADGDGMAVSMHEAKEVYRALKRSGKGGPGAAGTTHGSAPGAGAAGGATATANAADPSNGNGSTAGSSGASGTGLANNIVPAAPPLGRILWSPAEMVAAKISEAAAAAAAAAAPPLATVTESLAAGLASLPIGGALGANNRAANALLASPNSSSGTADGAGGRAKSPGGTAAGSSGQQQQQGQETQTVDDPFGQGAASAAAIAAFAAEELRQQALRGLGLGLGGNGSTGGNGSSGSGAPLRSASPSRAVSSSGGGLAPISASGLLAPGSATAAAVAAAAAVSNGASPGAAAAVAGSVLASAGGSASNAPVAAPPPGAAAAATSTASPYLCPSEWFVVDDPATDTRYFVIQGSDTLDHWKLNLTFDPVVFEDPALGVKVRARAEGRMRWVCTGLGGCMNAVACRGGPCSSLLPSSPPPPRPLHTCGTRDEKFCMQLLFQVQLTKRVSRFGSLWVCNPAVERFVHVPCTRGGPRSTAACTRRRWRCTSASCRWCTSTWSRRPSPRSRSRWVAASYLRHPHLRGARLGTSPHLVGCVG